MCKRCMKKVLPGETAKREEKMDKEEEEIKSEISGKVSQGMASA